MKKLKGRSKPAAHRVPLTGDKAFREGWDRQAVPFYTDTTPGARGKWLDEWDAACLAVLKASGEGGKR